MSIQEFPRCVAGCIVHDDDFIDPLRCFLDNGLDTGAGIVAMIVHRNNDGGLQPVFRGAFHPSLRPVVIVFYQPGGRSGDHPPGGDVPRDNAVGAHHGMAAYGDPFADDSVFTQPGTVFDNDGGDIQGLIDGRLKRIAVPVVMVENSHPSGDHHLFADAHGAGGANVGVEFDLGSVADTQLRLVNMAAVIGDGLESRPLADHDTLTDEDMLGMSDQRRRMHF